MGLHFQDDGDFPSVAEKELSDDNPPSENMPRQHSRPSGCLQGSSGKIDMKCACGIVLSGQTDPGKSSVHVLRKLLDKQFIATIRYHGRSGYGFPPRELPHKRGVCFHCADSHTREWEDRGLAATR